MPRWEQATASRPTTVKTTNAPKKPIVSHHSALIQASGRQDLMFSNRMPTPKAAITTIGKAIIREWVD